MMPRKDPTFCLELPYRVSVELDPSLIPARTLPYEYTDSYGISFENAHVNFQPALR
jgi:hypothetical protein